MEIIKRLVLALFLLLLAAGSYYYPKLKNVYRTLSFFEKENIFENFTQMEKYWPTKHVNKSDKPYVFPKGMPLNLPENFTWNGKKFNIQTYLDSSFTTGFCVIQNDSLIYENYYLGHSESGRHISWSMAKSVVSALFGIAMEEGNIESVEDSVEKYLPEMNGTAYEGVRIKDVLQMSTGVEFNEDYGDFNSDISRWGRYFAFGWAQDDFPATLERSKQHKPGTYNHYVSINTHILGMILVRTTGKSLTEYLQEKIWQPLGMEYNCYWLADDQNMEMALGGLNVTLRDYAKLGQLFLQKGKWQGKQIVPEKWVEESTTADAPHLQPGKDNPMSRHEMGYGYQWWIPAGDEGEFLARGIYNQYIYVNPTTRTVIVKNSANHNYNDKTNIHSIHGPAMEVFRAIANSRDTVKTMVPAEVLEAVPSF